MRSGVAVGVGERVFNKRGSGGGIKERTYIGKSKGKERWDDRRIPFSLGKKRK